MTPQEFEEMAKVAKEYAAKHPEARGFYPITGEDTPDPSATEKVVRLTHLGWIFVKAHADAGSKLQFESAAQAVLGDDWRKMVEK